MLFSDSKLTSDLADVTVTLCGNSLFQVPSIKYLGIHLQPSLNWEVEVAKKAVKVYSVLRRLSWKKDYLSKYTRRMLIFSLVMPHITQNAAAFTNMRVESQQRMQNLVNSCTRFITATPRYRPVSRVRIGLNILTFRNIRLYFTLCELHKVRHAKHSTYLKGLLHELTPRSARIAESGSYNVPPHRRDAYSKSFMVQGTRAWNKLPAALRCITKPCSFKFALKRHLRRDNTSRDRSHYF